MKLELKHLAPYLPYGLKFGLKKITSEFTCIGLVIHEDGIMANHKGGSYNVSLENYYKPILNTLGGIPQEIIDMSPYNTHNKLIEAIEDQNVAHNIFRVLIANHFDVFGLIEKGLAIDINTIQS